MPELEGQGRPSDVPVRVVGQVIEEVTKVLEKGALATVQIIIALTLVAAVYESKLKPMFDPPTDTVLTALVRNRAGQEVPGAKFRLMDHISGITKELTSDSHGSLSARLPETGRFELQAVAGDGSVTTLAIPPGRDFSVLVIWDPLLSPAIRSKP